MYPEDCAEARKSVIDSVPVILAVDCIVSGARQALATIGGRVADRARWEASDRDPAVDEPAAPAAASSDTRKARVHATGALGTWIIYSCTVDIRDPGAA